MKSILRIFQKLCCHSNFLPKSRAVSLCSFLPSLSTQSSSESVKFSEAKGNFGFKLYYRDNRRYRIRICSSLLCCLWCFYPISRIWTPPRQPTPPNLNLRLLLAPSLISTFFQRRISSQLNSDHLWCRWWNLAKKKKGGWLEPCFFQGLFSYLHLLICKIGIIYSLFVERITEAVCNASS